MNGNETLKKLIMDEKLEGVLELYEEFDMNIFLEIEKYYGGGYMELDESNVCEILKFSVYYNDNRIMKICKRYLKNHMTDSIMFEIFSLLNGLNIKSLNELRDMSEEYIKLHRYKYSSNDQLLIRIDNIHEIRDVNEEYLKLNGYKYLNNDDILLKLNLNSIKLILDNKKLLIKCENWLLSRLLFWYREVLKMKEVNKEQEEELNEFKTLIKTRINLNEIKKEEICKDDIVELHKLKIPIENIMNKHMVVNIDETNNEELKEIIYKHYINEEENGGEIELDENEKRILDLEEIKEEVTKILDNKDINVVEIVLNLIIEMNIIEIIPKEMKNRLLRDLLSEYGRYERNRTLKCLCLFVDDITNVFIIERMFGRITLFKILNEIYYTNIKSQDLLIKYIKEMDLSLEEEEKMNEIICDDELLEELKTKRITFLSYFNSHFSIPLYEEIYIAPSFDGEKCEFSIYPLLPLGISIDKASGIIYGMATYPSEFIEYEITCKNIKNEMKFIISLEYIVLFSEFSKSEGILISNYWKKILTTNDIYNHCYLDLIMQKGLYFIRYQFNQDGNSDNAIIFGLSTNNTYSGNNIFNQLTTCNFSVCYGESQDITEYCHIGTVVNSNPNIKNHGDGSIYEIIVDMNKREFWISHNNSSPVLLVKDLPSPLYTYAGLLYQDVSLELLSVSYQD